MDYISFVILHYKDIKVTDTCVQSILAMEQQERIRIVIVDNDIQKSEKDRKELSLKYQENSQIKILQIKENGGFSYANNQGYQYAKEHFGNGYIIVLNNDIEFTQKNFVSILEESYHSHPCHIIGPDVIRQGTGEHQNPMDTRLRTKEALSHQLQTDVIPFGACLIFTPLFAEKEEKAFDPETQFFYEEYILALRCRRKNYKIVYDPSMTVYHESGAATKKSYSTEKKRIRFMLEKTAAACEVYLEMLGE